MVWGSWIRVWALLGLALLVGGWPARAAALPGSPLTVCIARVAAGDRPAAMLHAPERFACGTTQTRLGDGDYWAVARVPGARPVWRPWRVRFASLWQRHTHLFARYSDGRMLGFDLDGAALARHLRPGAIVQVDLPPRPGALTTLLWRIDGSANLRGIVNGATLASVDQAFDADLRITAIYAAFAALCLTLLIYNLALLAAMRERFQIAYCAMVVALLAYAMASSGALAWMLPGLSNNDRLRINYLTLAVSASSALLFARYFFEERVFAGWLGRTVPGIVALQVATALGYTLLAPRAIPTIDRLYCLSFVPLLGIVAPVLWRAWRVRSDYVWLFALAWAAPVVMGSLRTASSLKLVPWSLWLDSSTIMSMSLEALLSSLAIAWRIRLLSQERDRARAGEHLAMQLADTDPLTGLLNRRAFLRDAIGRAGEQALILADIDHFKLVNDTLGHHGGDEVLRVIARALRQAAPEGALVARIGGEEFAVLSRADGAPAANALLVAVRRERMPFDIAVTVSLGCCAGALGSESDWKAIYARADAALFDAKAAGRDRARDAAPLAWAA